MGKILSSMEVGMNGGSASTLLVVLTLLKAGVDRETLTKEIEYAIEQRMQILKNGGTIESWLMYESVLADIKKEGK